VIDEKNKEENTRKYAVYYQANHEKMLLKTRRYRVNNKEKVAAYDRQYRIDNKEQLLEQTSIYYRTLKGRHKTIKYALKKEGALESELLWNINFYSELVRDPLCHYCSGLLNETGGGLDRIQNDIGHTCYNVVPCCRRCNRIKGHDLSYEEMMLLAPALKEIVRLKSSTQQMIVER